MKRLIGVSIAIILLVNMLLIGVFANETFTDLNGSHWAYDEIISLVDAGIINGYGNGEFRPNNAVTYKELIKLLVVATGGVVEKDPSDWAKPYIDYGVTHGWFYENEFDFSQAITREVCAYIISNALELEGTSLSKYISSIEDYELILESYKLAVLNVYDSGIITGDSSNEFKPQNTLSRAECAVIIMRIIDSSYRKYVAITETSDASSLTIQGFENDLLLTHQIYDVNSINNTTLSIIRRERYGDFAGPIMAYFWVTVAGSIPSFYYDYMEEVAGVDDFLLELSEIEFIEGKDSSESVDFIHMAAVIDTIYSDATMDDDFEIYIDYLCGFAGDLETFISNLIDYSGDYKIESYDDKYTYAYENIGGNGKLYFKEEDLLADIDGVNIANILLDENLLLSEAIALYYDSELVQNRYSLFIDSFGGETAFRDTIDTLMDGDSSSLSSDYDTFRTMLLFKTGTDSSDMPDDEDISAVYEAFYRRVIEASELERQ